MSDAAGATSHHFDVGPLSVHLNVAPPWAPAVNTLLESYAAGSMPSVGTRLRVDASFRMNPVADGPSSSPAFTPVAGHGWRDACVAWDARIEPSTAGRIRAEFQLRDRSSSVDAPRELVRQAVFAGGLRVLLATTAPFADAFLVHGASLLGPSGDAVLFLGESGAGKTTMARRLPGWRLLADDTTVVFRGLDGRFFVSGTPLAGKERLPRRHAAASLGRLVILERDATVLQLEPVSTATACAALLSRSMWFANDQALTARLLKLIQALAEDVSGARLASSLEHDVASALVGTPPLKAAEC